MKLHSSIRMIERKVMVIVILVSFVSLASAGEMYFSSIRELEEVFISLKEELGDETPVTIWYIPHPDDEIIGMAGALHRKDQKGITNILLFLSQGGGTLSRYLMGLTKKETKDMRTQEMKEAVNRLGLSSVYTVIRSGNGFPSTQKIKEIIGVTGRFFWETAYRTTSIHDPNRDHQKAAKALILYEEKQERKIDTGYYRVYHYNFSLEITGLRNLVQKETVLNRTQKQKALQIYQDGIAGYSTPALIQRAMHNPYEYRDRRTPSLEKIKWNYLNFIVDPDRFGLGFDFAKLGSKGSLHLRLYSLSAYQIGYNVDLFHLPVFSRFYAGLGIQKRETVTPYGCIGLKMGRWGFLEKSWPLDEPAHISFGLSLYLF